MQQEKNEVLRKKIALAARNKRVWDEYNLLKDTTKTAYPEIYHYLPIGLFYKLLSRKCNLTENYICQILLTWRHNYAEVAQQVFINELNENIK